MKTKKQKLSAGSFLASDKFRDRIALETRADYLRTNISTLMRRVEFARALRDVALGKIKFRLPEEARYQQARQALIQEINLFNETVSKL